MAGGSYYPNAELDLGIVRFYRNLQHHRSTILEGVRLIAFRNINHMFRAMKRLGIQSFSNDGEIEAVCDIMFQEQGMDPSLNSRQVLEFATTIPWESYCCLLFAELESYQRASHKNPSLRFAPLESFCLSHGDVLDHLNIMRDKVLHPGKRVHLSDAIDNFIESGEEVDGHYYSTVFQGQRLIDLYIAVLRTMLAQQIAEGVRPLAEGSGVPKSELEKFRWVRNILSNPLPVFGDNLEYERDQSPFNMRTWYILGLYRDYEPAEGSEFPSYLRSAKTDCMRMLMRSLVLHNEFVNMIDFGKLRGIKTRAELDAHHPLELMDVGNSTVDFQRAQDCIAPVRVGSALLAEPLRLYYQAISEVPALRLGEIEEIAGPGPVPLALRNYRNIVFHVAHESMDPDEIEADYVSEVSPETMMSLLPHLIRFYLSVG